MVSSSPASSSASSPTTSETKSSLVFVCSLTMSEIETSSAASMPSPPTSQIESSSSAPSTLKIGSSSTFTPAPPVRRPLEARVFVGGLKPETDEARLVEYFNKYGLVDEVWVIRDSFTGLSKCYGFVQFYDLVPARKALKTKYHTICGKTVSVGRAKSTSNQNNESVDNSLPRKIFIGGLPFRLTADELRNYFKEFGVVEEALVLHDNENRPRGFGFITFENWDGIYKLIKAGRGHKLKGKKVEVRIAAPKELISNSSRTTHKTNAHTYQQGFYPHQSYWNHHANFQGGYNTYISPYFPSYDHNYGFLGGYGGYGGIDYNSQFSGQSYSGDYESSATDYNPVPLFHYYY